MDEKTLPRATRFNVVGFCLAGVRVWQWSSSFFVWASFGLLYDHIQRSRLGATNRMKGVQYLVRSLVPKSHALGTSSSSTPALLLIHHVPATQGLASLVYSTLILCGVHVSKALGLRSWRLFAVVSLPGDLTIMGICLAKITILAYSGLPADCHGLTSDSCKWKLSPRGLHFLGCIASHHAATLLHGPEPTLNDAHCACVRRRRRRKVHADG